MLTPYQRYPVALIRFWGGGNFLLSEKSGMTHGKKQYIGQGVYSDNVATFLNFFNVSSF